MSDGAYLLELGTVPYLEAWDLQRSLAGAVSQGAIPDTVIFLEHPPVVTLGRRTDEGELHVPEDAKVDVVETLREYPWVNGEIRGDQIVTRNYVNLGFAVELADGKGLIVPVVKNAEGLNLLGIARSVADVARRAREKQLTPDDVTGGTFTITNPGGYGTFHGTPVISQPQAAILGTYAVVKRPWVVQDDLGEDVIAIRPIMNLTLTYDHRLVDGAYAGQFLHDLREKLQTWGESDY